MCRKSVPCQTECITRASFYQSILDARKQCRLDITLFAIVRSMLVFCYDLINDCKSLWYRPSGVIDHAPNMNAGCPVSTVWNKFPGLCANWPNKREGI